MLSAFTLPSSLMEPARLTNKPFWVGHIPFAFWVIETFRPRRLVELGTESGVSFCAFNQAISYFNVGCESFAVDTWEGDIQTGIYDESVLAELRQYHEPIYGHFARLIQSTFEEAAPRFENSSIDLLHIDGCHTYDAVSADFRIWKEKLSSRGIVLFHDVAVRENTFGVHKFFDEVRKTYPSFLFPHSNGLGILGVGSDIDPAIQALFDADQDVSFRDSVRAYFGRLGAKFVQQVEARCTAELVAKREAAKQESLIKIISERDIILSAEYARRDDRELEIERLGVEITDLRQALEKERLNLSAEYARRDDRDLEIERLGVEVADLRQVLEGARLNLSAEYARRDDREMEIERLGVEITDLRQALEGARLSLSAEYARRDDRELEIERLNHGLAARYNDLGEARQVIGSLATQIDELRTRLESERKSHFHELQKYVEKCNSSFGEIEKLKLDLQNASVKVIHIPLIDKVFLRSK